MYDSDGHLPSNLLIVISGTYGTKRRRTRSWRFGSSSCQDDWKLKQYYLSMTVIDICRVTLITCFICDIFTIVYLLTYLQEVGAPVCSLWEYTFGTSNRFRRVFGFCFIDSLLQNYSLKVVSIACHFRPFFVLFGHYAVVKIADNCACYKLNMATEHCLTYQVSYFFEPNRPIIGLTRRLLLGWGRSSCSVFPVIYCFVF